MSTKDIGANIRSKMEWHASEYKRLKGILEEFGSGQQPPAGQKAPKQRKRQAVKPQPAKHATVHRPSNHASHPTPPASEAAPARAHPKLADLMHRRPKQSPFVEAVRSVLKEGESLNSREIADRLMSAGYRSDAADPYPTIYNQLVSWSAKDVGIVKVGDRSTGVLFRRK